MGAGEVDGAETRLDVWAAAAEFRALGRGQWAELLPLELSPEG